MQEARIGRENRALLNWNTKRIVNVYSYESITKPSKIIDGEEEDEYNKTKRKAKNLNYERKRKEKRIKMNK